MNPNRQSISRVFEWRREFLQLTGTCNAVMTSPLHRHQGVAMGLLEIIIVIIILMAVFGGGYGYRRRGDWGAAPSGVFGLVVIILLVILIMRLI
jgi:hypothetical protein